MLDYRHHQESPVQRDFAVSAPEVALLARFNSEVLAGESRL